MERGGDETMTASVTTSDASGTGHPDTAGARPARLYLDKSGALVTVEGRAGLLVLLWHFLMFKWQRGVAVTSLDVSARLLCVGPG